jgi:hypothetical protein
LSSAGSRSLGSSAGASGTCVGCIGGTDCPAFKIGRSVYCSKLAVALWSLDLASKQRAEWSARAAAARPTPAVMNDFVRNQMGEMLRARLKMAVEQQGRRPAPAAAH